MSSPLAVGTLPVLHDSAADVTDVSAGPIDLPAPT